MGVKAILDVGILLVTGLAMAIVGMEVGLGELRSVSGRKVLVFTLLALQSVAVPAIALAVVYLAALPSHVAAGLLLVAACPVGNIASFYAWLGRANAALAVALAAFSCLLSFASMGGVFKIYTVLSASPLDFPLPTLGFFARLTVLAVLPVIAGMWMRRMKPEWVKRHLKKLIRLCFAGLTMVLAAISLLNREQLAADASRSFLSALLFIVLAAGTGYAIGFVLRVPARDRASTGIVFCVRNIGVALTIAVALMNRPDYAVYAVVYFLTQVPLLITATGLARACFLKPEELIAAPCKIETHP